MARLDIQNCDVCHMLVALRCGGGTVSHYYKLNVDKGGGGKHPVEGPIIGIK